MTNFRKSFVHVFEDRNYFWGSFVIGLAWQFFVIYTLGVNNIFQVVSLVGYDFSWVFGLGIAPLVAHKIVVCVLFLKRSYRVTVPDSVLETATTKYGGEVWDDKWKKRPILGRLKV